MMRTFIVNVQGKEATMKLFMALRTARHLKHSGHSWWQITLESHATTMEIDRQVRGVIGPVRHANVIEVNL